MRTYLVLSTLVLLSACQRDKIESYRIPKSTETTRLGAVTAPPSAPLQWTAPSAWMAQPISDMRVGSFRIPGVHGQTAEVSVVPLSGEAGGHLANINRWRQQIQLPPMSEAELAKTVRHVTYGPGKMLYVDFVSATPLIDNKFKKRIVAAIYARGEKTWFFKLAGEDETVRLAENDFVQFLKSVQFKSHE